MAPVLHLLAFNGSRRMTTINLELFNKSPPPPHPLFVPRQKLPYIKYVLFDKTFMDTLHWPCLARNVIVPRDKANTARITRLSHAIEGLSPGSAVCFPRRVDQNLCECLHASVSGFTEPECHGSMQCIRGIFVWKRQRRMCSKVWRFFDLLSGSILWNNVVWSIWTFRSTHTIWEFHSILAKDRPLVRDLVQHGVRYFSAGQCRSLVDLLHGSNYQKGNRLS